MCRQVLVKFSNVYKVLETPFQFITRGHTGDNTVIRSDLYTSKRILQLFVANLQNTIYKNISGPIKSIIHPVSDLYNLAQKNPGT
jgi:hypothetical protein